MATDIRIWDTAKHHHDAIRHPRRFGVRWGAFPIRFRIGAHWSGYIGRHTPKDNDGARIERDKGKIGNVYTYRPLPFGLYWQSWRY